MSLISYFVHSQDMPIYDNVEYARGCESFIFRAKNKTECQELIDDFIDTVPASKMIKVYEIGLRPDYPIPVARYFIEVCVDDLTDVPLIGCWTYATMGGLLHGKGGE